MYDKTLLRPTITLCTLLFASILLLGCTDTDLVAPEHEGVAEADAATNNSAGVQTETADVLDQMDPETGNRDRYAEDAATIRRTANGISVKVRMPTPEPGSYQYPDPSDTATDEEGPPEAFSLWVFVFDDPEDENWTGVFLGGGHVVGGPKLTLSGHVSRQTEPFIGDPLENPEDAEVHLAVAPHGALDTELMPEQIKTPSGPGPDIWWLALFEE